MMLYDCFLFKAKEMSVLMRMTILTDRKEILAGLNSNLNDKGSG